MHRGFERIQYLRGTSELDGKKWLRSFAHLTQFCHSQKKELSSLAWRILRHYVLVCIWRHGRVLVCIYGTCVCVCARARARKGTKEEEMRHKCQKDKRDIFSMKFGSQFCSAHTIKCQVSPF